MRTYIRVDNYTAIAAKYFTSIRPVVLSKEEFDSDMKYLSNVRGEITRYERLKEDTLLLSIINRIVTCSNIFTPEGAARLLYFKSKESVYHIEVLYTIFSFIKMTIGPCVVNEHFIVSNKTFNQNQDVLNALYRLSSD